MIQNALIHDAMEYVYGATGGRGTWISDRGYDDRKFFDRLLDRKRSFIIRLRLSEKTARILLDAHRRRHRAGTLAKKTELVHLFSAFPGQKKRRGRSGWCTAYPVGSGVVESACGHVVAQRMKITSRMSWHARRAEAMLQLRCLIRSGQWDTFWPCCALAA